MRWPLHARMTRNWDAWSLNIILDPYLHSYPTSISELVSQQTQIIRDSFSGVVTCRSPSFIRQADTKKIPSDVGWTQQK